VDITELKRAELEAQEQREALARIARTTRMGQLTGSIAHELNQPLTGILSNAQAAELLINKNQIEDKEFKNIITDIIADTKRASDIIRNLREMYREHKGEYISVDVNSIIEDVKKLLHSDFVMKQVKIDYKLALSLPPVNGNKLQLQQVLINLIMNSEQAMSDMRKEDRKIIIITRYDENMVKVWVEDFGPGIDAKKIDLIFLPLATWKSGGTGMGLAIGNNIIEAHGGKMWAENRPEGGARIGFALPVLKKERKQ
jgi:C4-dicarboxylate-specific signal transduction histidine kinase